MKTMRLTVKDLLKKKGKEKIVSLTAYDFSMALLLDDSVDLLLVGDSVGMVCLGYDSTLPVTMREMLHHTKAVARGVSHALLAADMPFGSCHTSEKAVRNAFRFLKEGGADAVKIEGGGKKTIQTVKDLKEAGISVIGHLGLTPQRVGELGGYKVQGKTPQDAARIMDQACRLEEAGVFAIVLECVPAELGRKITGALKIPTIGIGAGPHCDGQILVLYDLLGLQDRIRPRFLRTYASLGAEVQKAVRMFREDVQEGTYPSSRESF